MSPKLVILGSCKYEPYLILAVPEKIKGLWNTEGGYQKACEKFHPAIDECDFVIVFAPEGIGEHTKRDIEYAKSKGKTVLYLVSRFPDGYYDQEGGFHSS